MNLPTKKNARQFVDSTGFEIYHVQNFKKDLQEIESKHKKVVVFTSNGKIYNFCNFFFHGQ